MKLDKSSIERLKELLAKKSRITVVSHTNPDGDAIGSGLAWTNILKGMGHKVEFMVPNPYPYFLDWMQEINNVRIFKSAPKEYTEFIVASDIVFFLDLNQPDRLEELGKAVAKNETAKKVLIDHHLDPPALFDISISQKEASSASFLIYKVAEALGVADKITYPVAEALYVGISTDTGNFSFSNLTPELFRTVAKLVEKGVDAPKLNDAIYNNFSVDRTMLMGYLLSKKMRIMKGYDNVAYIYVSREELLRFNFKQGDSEGFVNIPLSIKGMEVSAFFMETKEGVKVSLRSKGYLDVNMMARQYFNGGGHKNAAGGKLTGSTLRKAVSTFRKAVRKESDDGK